MLTQVLLTRKWYQVTSSPRKSASLTTKDHADAMANARTAAVRLIRRRDTAWSAVAVEFTASTRGSRPVGVVRLPSRHLIQRQDKPVPRLWANTPPGRLLRSDIPGRAEWLSGSSCVRAAAASTECGFRSALAQFPGPLHRPASRGCSPGSKLQGRQCQAPHKHSRKRRPLSAEASISAR